jgi:hypothetical protein
VKVLFKRCLKARYVPQIIFVLFLSYTHLSKVGGVQDVSDSLVIVC